MRSWAVAASLAAVGVAVWLALTLIPSHDPVRIADAVEQHWYHEPQSWRETAVPVSAAALDSALGDIARVDLSRLSVITYARSCLVNGHWVPHLVVQGDAGPVMLLLMPKESLVEEVPLDLPQEGLRGVIVPTGEGSIAILGEDSESLETVRGDVLRAVEWST